MSGRKLPKFKEYLERLMMYAKANGISVMYTADENSEGEWLPLVRRIKIMPDMSNSAEIATFLHELGHSLDDTVTDPKMYRRVLKAYSTFYNGRPSLSQKALVINSEIRAWELGRRIAKALKIRLGSWYDTEQNISVKEYKEE